MRDSSSYFAAQSLVASGGKLYFSTSDGSGGVDLWTSDGTAGQYLDRQGLHRSVGGERLDRRDR